MQSEMGKNRLLLERLLDAALHLASRNLAFRGNTTDLDDVHIRSFLGRRLTHYLSPQAQNELINLCGEQVLNTFLAEREAAIYYSIICESTLEVSDTEQNVLLLRYTYQDGDVWKITERFCQFKDMQ